MIRRLEDSLLFKTRQSLPAGDLCGPLLLVVFCSNNNHFPPAIRVHARSQVSCIPNNTALDCRQFVRAPLSSVVCSTQQNLGPPAVCARAFVKCCLLDTTKPLPAGSLCARLVCSLVIKTTSHFTAGSARLFPSSSLFKTMQLLPAGSLRARLCPSLVCSIQDKLPAIKDFFARVPVASASFV